MALAGCGAVGSEKWPVAPGARAQGPALLTIAAGFAANGGRATRLDVVVVYTEGALAALPGTGPDWFRQRDALRSAFPAELSVVSLEVPPATPGFEVALPKDSRSRGREVRVFADYTAPAGWPAISLTPSGRVALTLGADAIAVEASR